MPTTTETKLMQTTNIKSRNVTLEFLNMGMSFNDLEDHFIVMFANIDEIDK